MENVKRLLPLPSTERQVVGALVGVDDENRPLIRFSEDPLQQAIIALSLVSFPSSAKAWMRFPVPVLVNLVGDNCQPVIVGLLHDHLFTSPGHDRIPDNSSSEHSHHKLNADFINIEGNDEIQFNCGKASLSLKKNGHVIIKGENITNRARKNNKIKGASVQVN